MSIKLRKGQTWKDAAECYYELWKAAKKKEEKWDSFITLFKGEFNDHSHQNEYW